MIRLSASAIGGANIPAEFRQKIGLDNRGDGIVVLNGPEVRRWTEEVSAGSNSTSAYLGRCPSIN